jgi:plastocyanin
VPSLKLHLSVAALAVALLTFALVAPAPGLQRPPSKIANARVAVKDNFFSARSLTIHQGDTVKWVWRGQNRHNVTFTRVPEGAVRRGSRSRRQGRWFRTFHKPGQYRYVCTLFAGMRGAITVEPPGESSLGSLEPSPPVPAGPGAGAQQ